MTKNMTETQTYKCLAFVPVSIRNIVDGCVADCEHSSESTIEKLRLLRQEVREWHDGHPNAHEQTVQYAIEDINEAIEEVRHFNPWR